MKNFLIVVALFVVFSCAEQPSGVTVQRKEITQERIDALVQSAQPLFNALRTNAKGKSDLTMVSYELVVDRATGDMTLLNFQSETFFSFIEEDESARAEGAGKYVVECHNNGKTTRTECSSNISCGSAIKACLDAGGCANICEAPKPLSAVRVDDVAFLQQNGLQPKDIQSILDLPSKNLEIGKAAGTLSSIKLYAQIQ